MWGFFSAKPAVEPADSTCFEALVDELRDRHPAYVDLLQAALTDPALRPLGVEHFDGALATPAAPHRVPIFQMTPLARAVGLAPGQRAVDVELALLPPLDQLDGGDAMLVTTTSTTLRICTGDAQPGWLTYRPSSVSKDAGDMRGQLVGAGADGAKAARWLGACPVGPELGAAAARGYPDHDVTVHVPADRGVRRRRGRSGRRRGGAITIIYCEVSGARTLLWLPPGFGLYYEYLVLPHRVPAEQT